MCKSGPATYRTSLFAHLLIGLVALSGCFRDTTPTPDDPGVVFLDADLGHTEVLADTGGEVLARLVVRTGDVNQTERSPLNLALVIDTSGSMLGDPIDRAREASLSIVDLMREGDFLSVVAFHTETEVLLPSTEVRRGDLDEIREKIRGMEARGTTDLAGGLRIGLQQVMSHRSNESIDRIVLLGDGVPNDPNPIVPLAQQAGNSGVPIAALGLGLEYDETLMGQIAQLSRGHFEYVQEADQVASVFRDQLIRVERMLARNAVLSLQPGPGVEISEVLGQETPQGGGGLALNLGDLSEGDRRELVVRMTAPGRREGALVELLDARLQFQDNVNEAGSLRRTAFLGARATADTTRYEASRNAEVHEAAAALRAATATLTAIRMVRTGRIHDAAAFLENANQMIGDSSSEQAASIQRLRRAVEAMPANEPAPSSVDFEESVREAHDESMDVLGY
ncbi:MAG: VWA domain-containing protein [Myxococcota bacterium]